MITIEEIRKNLMKARKEKGFSAYELSLMLGKDKSYISDIEKRRTVSLPVLLQICEILELQPEDLFKRN